MPAPFPVDPVLTGISIAYRNTRLIADEVLFRVTIGLEDFKYWLFPKGEGLTVPDTKVGRRSQPNEVQFTATETPSATEDYGLEDPVPQSDIDKAPPNYDPLGRSTEWLTDLIMLDREIRVAGLVFDAATYPAGNKVQLSGTSQWSDFANSTPIDDVTAGLDATLVFRPNIMVIGRLAWTKFSTHPDILKAVHGTSGDTGVARRQAVAEMLELEEILVGEAWLNTAREGQPVSIQRVWGKHAALLYRDRQADTRRGLTYGFTAQFGSRVSGSREDPNIGLRGGQRVRVGESVKELVTAADTGYFIEDAIA